jgi:hypothetical protein
MPVRVELAVSFASPLIKALKQQNFLLDLWGESRAAKSVEIHADMSVWRDPDILREKLVSVQTDSLVKPLSSLYLKNSI